MKRNVHSFFPTSSLGVVGDWDDGERLEGLIHSLCRPLNLPAGSVYSESNPFSQ